ncbi:GIY-YIG nuclease family protein [Streptomyces sp. NPDC088789]|uniref:GIY-YIG nuclease family protein n=1 Tax=Streptomyces sp. NPDC088789 TaxID=3365899 RepID=UPI00382A9451
MTRRLRRSYGGDRHDAQARTSGAHPRVEWRGCALPFRDAVGLETELHRQFASQRVSQVNRRKEFLYATPAEVRNALQRFAGQHLIAFTEEPQALEWRAGRRMGEADVPAAGAGGVSARTT